MRRALVLALAAVFVPAAGPAVGHAAAGGGDAGGAGGAAGAPAFSDGFGVRPIKRHGEEVAPSYFDLRAKPGERITQSVVMWNSSKQPIRLLIDGVDGVTGTTSGAVYANRDDDRSETSRWIRPSDRRVTLEPGERRKLDFLVRVADEARPGEHLGGLAFQNAHEVTSGSKFAVRQVLRVVLGVHVTIPGGAPARAELGSVALQALPGTQVPAAVLALRNAGELQCKPVVRVALKGGGQQRSVRQQLDTILPGDAIAFPLPLRGRLPAGTYNTTTAVDGCGPHQESTSALTLATSLSGRAPQPTAAADRPEPSPTLLPVWLLVAATGVGIGGGLGIALWWQRRRRPAAGGAVSAATNA